MVGGSICSGVMAIYEGGSPAVSSFAKVELRKGVEIMSAVMEG